MTNENTDKLYDLETSLEVVKDIINELDLTQFPDDARIDLLRIYSFAQTGLGYVDKIINPETVVTNHIAEFNIHNIDWDNVQIIKVG